MSAPTHVYRVPTYEQARWPQRAVASVVRTPTPAVVIPNRGAAGRPYGVTGPTIASALSPTGYHRQAVERHADGTGTVHAWGLATDRHGAVVGAPDGSPNGPAPQPPTRAPSHAPPPPRAA